MRKLWIGFYVFLLCLNTSVVNLKALEPEVPTDYEVNLEIDESIGELSATFDEIGRFSVYGLAKIGKRVGTEIFVDEFGVETVRDLWLYGLINSDGVVVVEPIYDEITDFDESHYLVRKSIALGEGKPTLLTEGLLSKLGGEVVLEPIYASIDDFSMKKMVFMSRLVINSNEVTSDPNDDFYWRPAVYAHENGQLAPITLPVGVNLDNYDHLYPYEFEGMLMMQAIDRVCVNVYSCTYYQKAWFIDAYGNKLSDFSFDYAAGHHREGDTIYLAYQRKLDRSQAQNSIGVVKIRTVSGQLNIEPFISEDEGYTSVWIDNTENKIQLTKMVNNTYTWAAYDFATQTYAYGSNQTLDSVEEIIVPGFEDVDIKRSCALNDLNMWACSMDVRYKDGSGVLTSGSYVNHSVEFNDYIVLYRWENGETYSNVLYQDQAGRTQILSESGFKGYVSFSGSKFIVVNAWSNQAHELSLIRLTESGAEVILENTKNAYVQSVNDYIEVGVRVDESHYRTSLLETSTGNVLLRDVYNFQIQREEVDGTRYGIFSSDISSTPKLFMVRDGVLNVLDIEVNHLGKFDESKLLELIKFNYYSCVQSIYDEASQSTIEVASNCYHHELTLMDSLGHVIVSGASAITRYDDAHVFLAQMNSYDENNHIVGSSYQYIYFDSEAGMVEPIRYTSNAWIDFDPSTAIAHIYSESMGNVLIKDGVPLDALNGVIAGASDTGRFANGLMVYRKYNAENVQETFVANQQGEMIQIEDVQAYSGAIVKNELGYQILNETSADGVFGVELIPLEGLMVNEQSGLNYIAGSVYVSNSTLNGQIIYKIQLLEQEGIKQAIASPILDANGNVGQFSCVTMNLNDKGLIRFSQLTNGSCDSTKVGLLNLNGDIVLPAAYHDDFKFLGHNIVVGQTVNDVKKLTLFNMDGTNALQNFGLSDEYFDAIDFSFAPYVVLGEDYGSYLLKMNSDQSLAYVGEYKISDFGTSGLYEITGRNANDQQTSGIIDAQGNTIIGLEQGYHSFMLDDVLNLIATVKIVDGWMVNSSMFDMFGNKLLPDEFTPEMKYDSVLHRNMISMDDRGFIKLLYNDPVLKRMTYDSYMDEYGNTVSNGWVESRAQFNNYYDMSQKKIIYDKSIYYSDSKTVDGFYRVEQVVPSDRSEEDLRNSGETYYFTELNGVRQIYEKKTAIYDALYNEVIPAGKYDDVDWDITKPLVTTRDMDCHFQADGSGYCSVLFGLVDKNGHEIIPPIYSNVRYLSEFNLYEFRDYRTNTMGYVNSLGEIVLQGNYLYSFTHRGLNWMVLMRNNKVVHDVDDPSIQTSVTVMDVFDLDTKQLILSDVYNLYSDKLNNLFERGHISIGFVPDEVGLMKNRYYDTFYEQYVEYYYITSGIKSGIIDSSGDLILDPNYDAVEEVRLETRENYQSSANVIPGYYKIGRVLDKQVCTYASVTEQNEIVLNETTCRDWEYGIYNVNEGILLEPTYSMISDVSLEGYAMVYENGVPQNVDSIVYLNGSDEPTSVPVTNFVPKKGLIDFYTGTELVPAMYEQLMDTSNPYPYQDTLVKFDKEGLIRLTLNGFEGLANRQGVVLEAQYLEAYPKSGKVYARLLDGSWEVRDLQNLSEVVQVSLSPEFGNLKTIEMIEDKIIAETRIWNELEEYSMFGVLNADQSMFLGFDYSAIAYSEGLWYLEKYDPLFGTYPRAVMDNDGNFLVPFTDRYDSLSEYVGGYAIGQAGIKTVDNSTGALNGPSLLSMFFMDVHAEENEFVLEILDEEGKVVCDLSELYESATLLGEVNGEIRALVKKDGKYYLAKLVETPVYGVKITGVELSNVNLTLKVRDSYQLTANVLPLNHTESKSMVWSSDDETVAVVDQSGLVKALGVGSTTIRLSVNQFEAIAKITVQNQTVKTPPNEAVREAVLNFVSIIHSIDKPDVQAMRAAKAEFIRQLRELKNKNSDYLSYLTPEEQDLYEMKLQTYFGDLIDIRVDEQSLPLQFKGLLMNLDVEQLIKGKKIVLRIHVEPRTSIDAFKMYMDENQLDGTSHQVFDLSIEDEKGVSLSEFMYPIQFTLALPEAAIGQGELVLLHNHESEFSTVSVTLNVGYTYSFTVDKLSEFVLVSAPKKMFKPLEVKHEVNERQFFFIASATLLIGLLVWLKRLHKN